MTTSDLWSAVVGQGQVVDMLHAAVRRPVHAYLFVGSPGMGQVEAARAFAGDLLCAASPDNDATETLRRVAIDVHPDVVNVERVGAFITIDQAIEITRLSMASPIEGPRKVIVVHDVHLLRDAGPALLKTIEEPPPSCVFVLLADSVSPDLATVASRCVPVEFLPLADKTIANALIAEGVSADRAHEAVGLAGGRLDRARVLATDAGFGERIRLWQAVPDRLDGAGATVSEAVDQLIAAVDAAALPLKAVHDVELKELGEREKTLGTRGSGRAQLVQRQKREARRYRTDEMRAGLSALSGLYRDRLLADPNGRETERIMQRLDAIAQAGQALTYNGNERLALHVLLGKLDPEYA